MYSYDQKDLGLQRKFGELSSSVSTFFVALDHFIKLFRFFEPTATERIHCCPNIGEKDIEEPFERRGNR